MNPPFSLFAQGLDEASRLLREERDTEGMRNILIPLHELAFNSAQTLSDQAFLTETGDDITRAGDCLRKWEQSGEDEDLTKVRLSPIACS